MKEETGINEELKKGFELYHKGEVEEAWECFQMILKEHPENEKARKAIELIEAHPKYRDREKKLIEDDLREQREKQKKLGEEMEEKTRREGVGARSNPAIPWMIIGFVLVVIGLFLLLSASSPQPPSGMQAEDWENYADEVENYAGVVRMGSIIELLGLLIFMSATIWGVSWNAKK